LRDIPDNEDEVYYLVGKFFRNTYTSAFDATAVVMKLKNLSALQLEFVFF
jgi:hypothetical protein